MTLSSDGPQTLDLEGEYPSRIGPSAHHCDCRIPSRQAMLIPVGHLLESPTGPNSTPKNAMSHDIATRFLIPLSASGGLIGLESATH
jgi:hypothetical protein